MSSRIRVGESPFVRLVKQPFLAIASVISFALSVVESAVHPVWPNPSIEGTSNIWLRQLSAAPHVKR
jgi:hypothetical protein